MISEPNPKDLLSMIGFVYRFTSKNSKPNQFEDIGNKRITAVNFHINGDINIFLSDINDLKGEKGDYYDLYSLIFNNVPNGQQRSMPLPYFVIPPEHRAKKFQA